MATQYHLLFAGGLEELCARAGGIPDQQTATALAWKYIQKVTEKDREDSLSRFSMDHEGVLPTAGVEVEFPDISLYLDSFCNPFRNRFREENREKFDDMVKRVFENIQARLLEINEIPNYRVAAAVGKIPLETLMETSVGVVVGKPEINAISEVVTAPSHSPRMQESYCIFYNGEDCEGSGVFMKHLWVLEFQKKIQG